MGRKKIDPAQRKQSISITLTPGQRYWVDWAAAREHETASVLVGRLIEAEARRISRRDKVQLPDPQQLRITEPGQASGTAARGHSTRRTNPQPVKPAAPAVPADPAKPV